MYDKAEARIGREGVGNQEVPANEEVGDAISGS